jgi:peptidoglycan/xylan/chitin deacetylase (PgdA/CDA1 family)
MTSSIRWHLKKTARKSVALGHWATHRIKNTGESLASEVRVLTYHRFGQIFRDPFCVSSNDFAMQMAWLAEHGLAVSLADVEAFVHEGKAVKPGSVLVTIDDGFQSVGTIALPILKRYRIPALVFVSSGNVGRTTSQRNQQGETPIEDYMDWHELCQLVDAGLEIGSHAITHRSLGRMPIGEVEAEIQGSRAKLEQELGRPITAFAYPYGTLADFNDDVAMAIKSCGYRLAFTSQHGAIRQHMDAMTLPRIKVEGGEDPWLFPLMAQGGLDAWRWIDRALWRIQASGRG